MQDLKRLGNVCPALAGVEQQTLGSADLLLVHKQDSTYASSTLKPSPCCQASQKAGQVGSVGRSVWPFFLSWVTSKLVSQGAGQNPQNLRQRGSCSLHSTPTLLMEGTFLAVCSAKGPSGWCLQPVAYTQPSCVPGTSFFTGRMEGTGALLAQE